MTAKARIQSLIACRATVFNENVFHAPFFRAKPLYFPAEAMKLFSNRIEFARIFGGAVISQALLSVINLSVGLILIRLRAASPVRLLRPGSRRSAPAGATSESVDRSPPDLAGDHCRR